MTQQQIIHNFPGRWIGGFSLVIAPLLLLSAELLRVQFGFFFTDQIQAFADYPLQIMTSYNLFLAGNILLWPGIVRLVNMISVSEPKLALWGGVFVILGLFARTFHYGVNHLAFQLARFKDVDLATSIVGDTYGAFHIVSTLNITIMLGWIILAIGAYRSRTLQLTGSIGLALMSALMLGVLKGASYMSILATLGVCIALIPLGIKVLREGPTPNLKDILKWIIIIIIALIVMYLFGQAG